MTASCNVLFDVLCISSYHFVKYIISQIKNIAFAEDSKDFLVNQMKFPQMIDKVHQNQVAHHVDGFAHNCSISIAYTLEILQSYTNPSMCW